MKQKLALVKNIVNLTGVWHSVAERPAGLPGLVLVYGTTGAGKTTAVTWLANRPNVDALFIRAQATWGDSKQSLLDALLLELEIDAVGRNAMRFRQVVEAMTEASRPLIVDEIDYLVPPFGNFILLEMLRDLHDITGIPILLVGMQGIERQMPKRKQLARRISDWVEFQPLDLEDARVLADTITEVHVTDDLLAALYEATRGIVGHLAVGLARIEKYARANRLEAISLADWGDRPFILG
jgi:DNA transposition AAA+ family ATPase